MVDKILQLRCTCNSYSWGKKGSDSLAACLCAKTNHDFKVDESKPYAEMWMGSYPTLPSHVLSTDENLQDVLNRHSSELIGSTVLHKFNQSSLPFLPKILSVAKATPLQLHPNKSVASQLNTKMPQVFTDPNHKPELAVALTGFEVFCGFKPLTRIDKLMNLKPLRRFRPAIAKPAFDDQTLKHIVHEILSASDAEIASVGKALYQLPPESFGPDTYISSLLLRLWDQYSATDPGTIVALITMNYIRLFPGQALYIPSDGIHAYLSGDILTCGAPSTNALKTGFCPRSERDSVDVFCSTLTFTPHYADETVLRAELWEGGMKGKTMWFRTPVGEFGMLWIRLGSLERERVRAVGGPSVMVVVRGGGGVKGKDEREYVLGEGSVFLVGQGEETEFVAGSDGLEVYGAFVE